MPETVRTTEDRASLAPAGTAAGGATAPTRAAPGGGAGPRPWHPPAFTDVELAHEVTAYAGRW
ncbi:hypothetical protein GCM10020000_73720 [Streptomyces olivoverticillatus]